jgi:hypothetical protein
MNILNSSFNTLNAERKSSPRGKITVANNIKIDSMENANIGVDKTNMTLKIGFSFTSQYNPDFATLTMKGIVIGLEEKKKAEDLISEWNKTKKLNKEFSLPVLNTLMTKCSIQAIIMARDLGLPSPVSLPKIGLAPAPAAKPAANSKKK